MLSIPAIVKGSFYQQLQLNICQGPLPWRVLFEKNYENLQNLFLLKTLLLSISHNVDKNYHVQNKS